MKYVRAFGKLLGVYFVIHSIRDLLQYLGVHNVFTDFGHQFGMMQTERILHYVGLNYNIEYEIYFFLFELLIGLSLILISSIFQFSDIF